MDNSVCTTDMTTQYYTGPKVQIYSGKPITVPIANLYNEVSPANCPILNCYSNGNSFNVSFENMGATSSGLTWQMVMTT